MCVVTDSAAIATGLMLAAADAAGLQLWCQQRLEEQRADHAAGRAASLRADCGPALARLNRAAADGLDAAVSARPRAERMPCLALQAVQIAAAKASPGETVRGYLTYLDLEPPPARVFAAVAQRAARDKLTSAPLDTIMSAALCQQDEKLAEFEILDCAGPDALAAEFLGTCGARLETVNPVSDYQRYLLLHRRFPDTPQAPPRWPAWAGSCSGWAATSPARNGRRPGPYRSVASLGARTRVILQNDGVTQLSMIFIGPDTRVAEFGRCAKCVRIPAEAEDLDCPGSGRTISVTLPAGQYGVARLGKEGLPAECGWGDGISRRARSTTAASIQARDRRVPSERRPRPTPRARSCGCSQLRLRVGDLHPLGRWSSKVARP